MQIGLVYDTFDAYPWTDDVPPDAEYEPTETVDTLAAAVAHLGHEPVRIGTASALRERLAAELDLDAALNIAKGQPWFLETNPLPTFKPVDTFAIIAEVMGRDYVDYLTEVFERGLRRLDLA